MNQQIAETYTGPFQEMDAAVASLTHCLYARLIAAGHSDLFVRVIRIDEVYAMPVKRFDIETVDLNSRVHRFTVYPAHGSRDGYIRRLPSPTEDPQA